MLYTYNMIWHAAVFFIFTFTVKSYRASRTYFFSNCNQVWLQRYFVCMLHTSNRETLIASRLCEGWRWAGRGRSWVFFDAEAAPSFEHFASLTSWGAGMPIGELSWSIAALLKCNGPAIRRCQAFFPWLWIVNSMSFLNLATRKTPFRFAKKTAKRMFSTNELTSTITIINITSYNHFWNKKQILQKIQQMNPQAEPRALMRPEPPEDLKRKPRPMGGMLWEMGLWNVVECWYFFFWGDHFWGRNFHFWGDDFWGRDFVAKKQLQQILMKLRDSKVLNLHHLWAPTNYSVFYSREHMQRSLLLGWFGWLVGFCGWRRWLCCLCHHSPLSGGDSRDWVLNPTEGRTKSWYHLQLDTGMQGPGKHWKVRNGCYQFRSSLGWRYWKST